MNQIYLKYSTEPPPKYPQSFTGKTCSPLLHYHCVNHANSCGNAIANSQGLLHAFELSQTKKIKIRNKISILMNNQEIIVQSKEMTRFLLLKLDSRFPNKRVTFARDYKFRNGIFSRA
jgi:hypothetical protein